MRRITVDGDRHRLRWGVELKEARHPGVAAAITEAQSMVLAGHADRVEVLDVEADDVLYIVRREESAVITDAA